MTPFSSSILGGDNSPLNVDTLVKMNEDFLLPDVTILIDVNPDECIKNIKNYDVFLNGGTITSKGESTIIEIENEEIKIIREGALRAEDILIFTSIY